MHSLSVFDHMTTERSFPITAITTYDGSRINTYEAYFEIHISYSKQQGQIFQLEDISMILVNSLMVLEVRQLVHKKNQQMKGLGKESNFL